MELAQQYKNNVVDACQRLIRARSYSGQERDVAAVLRQILAEYGYTAIETDRYGSVTACLQGNRPGKTVLMDAHMDTVEVTDPDSWTYAPFAAAIQNDRIYGRGASDMKGALAAMIAGAAMYRDQTRGDFPGAIVISGTVHEECFEGVAAKEVADNIRPDVVIIGEATELEIAHGQRGRAEIVVETMGKQCHSSKPQNGVNAVHAMMDIAARIDRLKNIHQEHLGDSVLALTDIISSPYPGASVIPDRCRVTYDRRTLLGENIESVLAPIREIIDVYVSDNPQASATASISESKQPCYTGESIASARFFSAWLFDRSDWHIRAAAAGLAQVGLDVAYRTYSFCTNGSYFAGCAGIDTLGFGPSREALAHIRDEYISIDQLYGAVLGYAGITSSLLEYKE